ncbi:hypothetical protein HOK51_00255 [Candidatus Woesearchaeota archaeon]|jgi:hypothetical protein|nr:hypothetical protein [Candidatus Woesearchaeota archaeon]
MEAKKILELTKIKFLIVGIILIIFGVLFERYEVALQVSGTKTNILIMNISLIAMTLCFLYLATSLIYSLLIIKSIQTKSIIITIISILLYLFSYFIFFGMFGKLDGKFHLGSKAVLFAIVILVSYHIIYGVVSFVSLAHKYISR